jgi:hypothetical protein
VKAELLRGLAIALGLESQPQDILRSVQGAYDAIDASLAEGRADLQLPCHAGCSQCCREAVFVCAAEFFCVADAVLAWAPARRHALLDDMARVADRFEDELELLETLQPGFERDEVAARVRFDCPLLSGQGHCTVYAVRELNARTFGQSMDENRGEAYGCGLTHERLALVPAQSKAGLYGAHQARRDFVERVQGTEVVHVYPWWFTRYAGYLSEPSLG